MTQAAAYVTMVLY